MHQFFKNLYYSFPVQLFLMHFRNNPFLLLFWALLFLLAGGAFGKKYGVWYLFLDPEYLGEVSFWSFFFIGICFSTFLMAWNVSTYVMNSHHFPFLASLNRPFSKFCLNNAIIPITWSVYYLTKVVWFQTTTQDAQLSSILWYISGFLVGLSSGLAISSLYFYATNRDIYHYIDNVKELRRIRKGFVSLRNDILNELQTINKNITKINETLRRKRPKTSVSMRSDFRRRRKADRKNHDNPYGEEWEVWFYLTSGLGIRRVRNVQHYNPDLLVEVYRQNHSNAFVIQIVSVLLLLLLGLMIDYEPFMIPAIGSGLLLFSMLVSLSGALAYWLRGFFFVGLVAILGVMDWVTGTPILTEHNMVFGINYDIKPERLSYGRLDSLSSVENYETDYAATLKILERWKSRQPITEGKKPKMVFVCTSGGGMMAGVWAMTILGKADSLLHGTLLQKTTLMTGASGGMLGAAYYRELYLRKQQKILPEQPYNSRFINQFSHDLLNPILFTLAVNDFFVPWLKVNYHGQKVHKDRGYMFEQQLLKNTDGMLDKSIADYRRPEQNAQIPMMLLTPAIVNDGRHIIISPQGMTYMTKPPEAFRSNLYGDVEGIDFGRFFANHGAQNLRFTSALRMNATYPYILPNVHLPSSPIIEVMDAGVIDNYGVTTAARFIDVYKDWIKENTDGVVLLQVLQSERRDSLEARPLGIITRFLNPISVATLFLEMQEFHQDDMMNYLVRELGRDKVDIVQFAYRPGKNAEKASLSFHLTKGEKKDVINAWQTPENQLAMRRLRRLLQ